MSKALKIGTGLATAGVVERFNSGLYGEFNQNEFFELALASLIKTVVINGNLDMVYNRIDEMVEPIVGKDISASVASYPAYVGGLVLARIVMGKKTNLPKSAKRAVIFMVTEALVQQGYTQLQSMRTSN